MRLEVVSPRGAVGVGYAKINLITVGIVGPPGGAGGGGGGGVAGDTPTFIQSTTPAYSGAYSWWDTSGGNLTLWIEDGL